MLRQRGKRKKIIKEPFSYGAMKSKLAEGLKQVKKVVK